MHHVRFRMQYFAVAADFSRTAGQSGTDTRSGGVALCLFSLGHLILWFGHPTLPDTTPVL
jgi:hypothetical protein